MSCPFKDANEFLGATGTLHSFTGHPASVTITLVISAAMTVYFLYKAYTVR